MPKKLVPDQDVISFRSFFECPNQTLSISCSKSDPIKNLVYSCYRNPITLALGVVKRDQNLFNNFRVTLTGSLGNAFSFAATEVF